MSMTAQTGTLRYATKATYGSVAYDLNAVPGYYEQPKRKERAAAPARQKVQKRTKIVVRGEHAAQDRPSISLMAVVGYLVAAAMLVLVLLAYINLTETNAQTVELQSQLSTLTDEGKKLEADYKAAFNMTQVADYAQNVLGMVPAAEENTEYLEIQKEDMAVILEHDTPTAESGGSVFGFLTSLMSYFR
jgi:hypothetical protein